MGFKTIEERNRYNKEYYIKQKEKILQQKQEYYLKNKQVIKIKTKEYRDNNKEKINLFFKKFRVQNKQKLLNNKKEYYRNNKPKIKERQRIQSLCRSCKLFGTIKLNNYLCSYCNPDKITRQKSKELQLKTFFEVQGYVFIYNKKCNISNTCQTYYPDFVFDCLKFFLIIECDERGHSHYSKQCERIRENNICFSLGLPCVFIRYNPDKRGITQKTKEMVLKSYIEYYKNSSTCDNEVVYLFY
jgi:hypothetical protein